jgi:hypothetical protein
VNRAIYRLSPIYHFGDFWCDFCNFCLFFLCTFFAFSASADRRSRYIRYRDYIGDNQYGETVYNIGNKQYSSKNLSYCPIHRFLESVPLLRDPCIRKQQANILKQVSNIAKIPKRLTARLRSTPAAASNYWNCLNYVRYVKTVNRAPPAPPPLPSPPPLPPPPPPPSRQSRLICGMQKRQKRTYVMAKGT